MINGKCCSRRCWEQHKIRGPGGSAPSCPHSRRPQSKTVKVISGRSKSKITLYFWGALIPAQYAKCKKAHTTGCPKWAEIGLCWLGFRVFHYLPDSAWADGNLAEAAGQDGVTQKSRLTQPRSMLTWDTLYVRRYILTELELQHRFFALTFLFSSRMQPTRSPARPPKACPM